MLQLTLGRVSDEFFKRTLLDFTGLVSMPGKAPFQTRVSVIIRSNFRLPEKK